jgi:hypothetical protein
MTAVDPTWIRPEPGWVCAECGFDFDACEPSTTPELIKKLGSRYRVPLSRGLADEDLDALLRTRPAEGTWSALEYACHTRDVFGLNVYRVERVVAEDRPSFEVADRDRAAVDREYNGQDPAVVADEIAAGADTLAQQLGALSGDDWQRIGRRGEFTMTIEWMSRNVVHEATHHLLDIARALRSARGR